jgi:mono/diheme cytochrome c family protein
MQKRGASQSSQGRKMSRISGLIAACFLVLLAIAACGRSADEPGAAAPTPRVIPTMPQARFAQPTTMIGAGAASAADAEDDTADVDDDADETDVEVDAAEDEVDVEEAENGDSAAEAAPQETPTPAVDLARGETVYGARGCGDCHGERAQGVPGEGSALAGLTMSESEFSSILRTGGSGRLGPDHLYGTTAISPGGMTALHAWLQSLESE